MNSYSKEIARLTRENEELKAELTILRAERLEDHRDLAVLYFRRLYKLSRGASLVLLRLYEARGRHVAFWDLYSSRGSEAFLKDYNVLRPYISYIRGAFGKAGIILQEGGYAMSADLVSRLDEELKKKPAEAS